MKQIHYQQEINAQRRKNEANLRIVQQYFASYGNLSDDRSLEQIAPGLATLEFIKKNCPEGTKVEDFCMQAGQFFEYELYQFGDIIFNYGDNGNKVYIILKGEVAVLVPRSESEIQADIDEIAQLKQPFDYEQCWKNKKPLKQIQIELLLAQKNFNTCFKNNVCQFKKVYQFYSGQSFGDVALVSDKPRTASILVVSDTIHLLSLSKKNFKVLCEKSVQEMNQTMEYFLKIFPNVGRMQISKFIQFFHKVEFAPQQILWKEGDQVKYFLLIQKGRIEVKQLQMLLYQVQDNAIIGHEEILEGMSLQQYTCKTLDITTGYLMEQDDFNVAKKSAPDIVKILHEKAHLMSFFLNQRKEDIKKGIIHIEPLQLPVERRLVKDMFIVTTPRNNEIRSSVPKSLSYFDITKFNKQKSKPNMINPQISISDDLLFFKEKVIKTNKSPTNVNNSILKVNKQIKDVLMKKFKLQYKYNSIHSFKISSCSSLFESSMKSRFKTEGSIDN